MFRNTRNLNFILYMLSVCLFLTSCGNDLYRQLLEISEAKLDNWSQEKPLTIYAYPFLPSESMDPESRVGIYAWKGMTDGIILADKFTKGKIQHKGFSEKKYHEVLEKGTLKKDFEKASGNKREVLSKACEKNNVEALMYGLYDGDDMGIKLSMYMYVKQDNIIVKERDEFKTTVEIAVQLKDHIDENAILSSVERALQDKIYDKTLYMSTRAINKYINNK